MRGRLLLLLPLALAARWVYLWATPLPGGRLHREVRGVYHVHTTRSDGRATLGEVAAAAARDGLDFVVVTDHNVAPLPAQRRQGVLLVYGDEESTPWGHRVVLSGSRDYVFWAHPGNRRVPWTDWSAPADGIEVSSADDMWRDALRPPWARLLLAAADYPAAPIEATYRLEEREAGILERYDALTAERRRRLSALCAIDAHGLPPYPVAFQTIQLHLPHLKLGGATAADDARALADALARGDFYCGLDGFADASGLALDWSGPVLHVALPSAPPSARAVVYCHGREAGSYALPATLPDAGGCRLEIRRPDLAARFPRSAGTWILTGTL